MDPWTLAGDDPPLPTTGPPELLSQYDEQCKGKLQAIERALLLVQSELKAASIETAAAQKEESRLLEVKSCLSEQLQQLIQDANRGRHQKLQYIVDSYAM